MSAYFDIAQHPHPTRQGEIALPIFYFNTACVLASFTVALARAQALLPPELVAVRVAPGLGLATVAFFQYVDSTVGPYHEMGLAVAARPAPERFRDSAPWRPADSLLPGMYVVDLPVTTEIANAAGRELWGYPKIVAPIAFQLRGSDIDCAVYDGAGAELCRLHGRHGPGLRLAPPDLMTYTCRDGQLLRTVIDMRGRLSVAGAGRLRLAVAAREHALCRHLQALELDGRAPRLVLAGQGLQARLPEGRPVR